MKKNLKQVNGCSWAMNKQNYLGKYRDEEGNGLTGYWERDNKKTTHILHLYNGNIVTKYRFPKIEIPFKSDMHNWKNMFFATGGSDEELVERVANKQKPVGFIIVKDKDLYIDKIKKLNIDYIDLENSKKYNYSEIGMICCNEKLEDLFDINSLIVSYNKLGEAYNKRKILEDMDDIMYLKEVCKRRLSDFLKYDYANPHSDLELIIVGLILGYPIESTFSCIVRTR